MKSKMTAEGPAKVIDPIEPCGQYGLHVIDFPSGRFGYVGSVPYRLAVNGVLPTFATRQEAMEHIAATRTSTEVAS